MRVACLLVPDLPLAAEHRAHPALAGVPLAIASGSGPRAELVAISPEAAGRGVRPRSSVAHARAVCPELCIRIASPALECAARDALLDAALSCSPRAALAPRACGAYVGEAAVHLDASGVASLFRSEAGFAAALGARARRLGLPGSVAVASSRSVAQLVARRISAEGEQTCVLHPGDEVAFLAALPIDLLLGICSAHAAEEDDLAETLTHFGVRTVRELLALPRRGLSTRIGPSVLRLIARVQGEETEAPLPVPPARRLIEAIDLESPIDRLQPLSFVLQGLLSRLLTRLEARQLACGELSLRLDLDGGARDAWQIGVAAPTLDLRALVRLAGQALETRPPGAPVEGVAIETRGHPLRSDQLDLFRPAGPAPTTLGTTLAELGALCGSERIGSPRVADTHHPEAFEMDRFQPPRIAPPEGLSPPALCLALRALRPPVPAAVRIAGDRPEWIRSAVVNGRVLRIAGPWRTTGGWWSGEGRFAYDHFDVQTSDGIVARLRFDHVGRAWHVDAVYD